MACRVLSPEEEIDGAVEAVSFDNTLGKLRKVVGEGLNEDRTIPVCSEKSDRTSRVNTKYKTVDGKVRPVAAPLP